MAPQPAPEIDTHLHVFHRGLRCTADARYRPSYDAPLRTLWGLMRRNGIERAVLVQPSFLGTDNGYMLDALRAEPERLRGVAVLDPTATDAELEAMDAVGVVGLRFNTIGRGAAAHLTAERRSLAARVGRLGWHLEIQCEEKELASVLDFAAGQPFRMVIDHFGIPDGTRRGFDLLLSSTANVHVKVSAPYRSPGEDHAALLCELVTALGAGRLLWGSDWPFTRHEAGRSYETCLDGYQRDCPDADVRKAIDAAGLSFFGFTGRQQETRVGAVAGSSRS